MMLTTRFRYTLSGWALLLGLCLVAFATPTQAKTIDPVMAEKIYKAIEAAQTNDPESYISTFDFQAPNGAPIKLMDDPLSSKTEQTPLAASSCSGLPTHGKVYGSALLDGEALDYEIDFHDFVVAATYQGERYMLQAKDLIDFQSKEGWPCAVPVAAVICAISGGAFCGWRISQCYRAAENCRCGVAVYNCGVCGEGSGVQCNRCEPLQRDLPDLRPIWRWPVSWGY